MVPRIRSTVALSALFFLGCGGTSTPPGGGTLDGAIDRDLASSDGAPDAATGDAFVPDTAPPIDQAGGADLGAPDGDRPSDLGGPDVATEQDGASDTPVETPVDVPAPFDLPPAPDRPADLLPPDATDVPPEAAPDTVGDAGGDATLDAAPDGTTGTDSCVAESDSELCLRAVHSCGEFQTTDRCGRTRWVPSCGSCTGLEVCGGGGQAGVCGGRNEPSDPICTPDGWCWDNPLPQGAAILAISSLPSGHDWVVAAGATVLNWNASAWRGWAALVPGQLAGIWAASDTDVWAVGDGGTILRWDGASWKAATSPTSASLRAVWGTAANDVWAVGTAGTVLHWDGRDWTKIDVGTTAALNAVWGLGASDVWVVGDKVILHNGPGGWTLTASAATLNGVWAASSTDVWAVGNQVLRWNGVAWNRFAGASGKAVFGNGANDVWVGGAAADFRHFDGLTLSLASGGVPRSCLRAIAGTGETLLAGGCGGELYRRIGGRWLRVTRGVPLGEYGRFSKLTVAPSVMMAAGVSFSDGSSHADTAEIIGRDASSWVPLRSLRLATFGLITDAVVDGLSAVSPTDAWCLAGNNRQIVRNTSSGWFIENTPDRAHLYDLLAFGAQDIWAVGEMGAIYHSDGSRWSPVPSSVSGTAVSLQAIDGRADDFWVAGASGTLLRYQRSVFTAVASGTTAYLTSLSAPLADVALAGGEQGIIAWDGKTWQPTAVARRTQAVLARSASEGWALVDGGDVWQQTAAGWNLVPSLETLFLGSAWAADIKGATSGVYVLGLEGEVLSRR